MITYVVKCLSCCLFLTALFGCTDEASDAIMDMAPPSIQDMSDALDMPDLVSDSEDATQPDLGTEDMSVGLDMASSDMFVPRPKTECEAYCLLMQSACTQSDAVFFSAQGCGDACVRFPTSGRCDDFNEPATCDDLGDTVQCRLYHAGAARNDPEANCPQAAPDSFMANGNGGRCAPLGF